MNINSLLNIIAADLNDNAPGHAFTTWSQEQLRAYAEEALEIAYYQRPDLFIKRRVIRLQPCTYMHDTCDCTKVYRVHGQTTKDGRIIRLLRPEKIIDRPELRLKLKERWRGRTCPLPRNLRGGKFYLESYELHEETDTLWLYPMVPPGEEVYITVDCLVPMDKLVGNFDVLDEFRAAVMQWVLYRAKMIDAEHNPTVLSAAKEHSDNFWKLLAVHVVMQEATEGDDAGTTSSPGVRRNT